MNDTLCFDLKEFESICKNLKIPGFCSAVTELRDDPASWELSQMQWIMTALRHELTLRAEKALKRRLKEAQFKHQEAVVSNIDFSPTRGLKKSQIMAMMNGDWIRAKQNCVITGKAGVGKTWVASALGSAACRVGLKVKFIRMPFLLDNFKAAAAMGCGLQKLVLDYEKFDLLILDDWGYGKMDATSRRSMMELVEARERTGSILITSILPIKDWAQYVDDPTFSDAINDRFLSNVIRIELCGPSRRTGVD